MADHYNHLRMLTYKRALGTLQIILSIKKNSNFRNLMAINITCYVAFKIVKVMHEKVEFSFKYTYIHMHVQRINTGDKGLKR